MLTSVGFRYSSWTLWLHRSAMAFKNGLSERLDELRFPSPRSPPSESAFPGYTSLSPGHSNLNSAISRPSGDVRANLQRRFTTDSSKFSSSWNYLSQPGQSGQDSSDLLSSVSISFLFPCSLRSVAFTLPALFFGRGWIDCSEAISNPCLGNDRAIVQPCP